MSSAQIKAIHALARKAGLDEASRRDVIAAAAGGKRSAADLTAAEAGAVIERLRGLSEGAKAPLPAGAMRIEGAYAGILRALWLSAYNLGLVKDRTDRALAAFVRRQAGLDHPSWLREPAHAAAVIDALRGWMTRDAGVVWPPSRRAAEGQEAVIAAQCRLLGIERPAGAPIEVMAALGRRIRRARP